MSKSKKVNNSNDKKKIRSIKGPRSALTDFIREEGINIDDINQMTYIHNKENGNQMTASESLEKSISEENKDEINKPKKKKIRTFKPFEIINRYNFFESLEYKVYLKVLEKIEEPEYFEKITDEQLEIFSQCLSLSRNVTEETFNFLGKFYKKRFICKDCSNLKNLGKIITNKLEILELRLCGPIKNTEINCLLKRQKNLKTLIFTGCFEIENLEITNKIKSLDISKSSRINVDILEKLKNLNYLNISFCTSFDKNYILNFNVKELECEETFISDIFFKNIKLKELIRLNLNNCLNISDYFNFNEFKKIEELQVEGISTIKTLNLPKTVKKLNIKNCFNFENLDFIKKLILLEDLNISNINFSKKELMAILELKNLRKLNLSWNEEVDDELIYLLCKLKFIEEISVFGCFKLTEKVAEYAWTNGRIEIIGNPAETKFLLN